MIHESKAQRILDSFLFHFFAESQQRHWDWRRVACRISSTKQQWKLKAAGNKRIMKKIFRLISTFVAVLFVFVASSMKMPTFIIFVAVVCVFFATINKSMRYLNLEIWNNQWIYKEELIENGEKNWSVRLRQTMNLFSTSVHMFIVLQLMSNCWMRRKSTETSKKMRKFTTNVNTCRWH